MPLERWRGNFSAAACLLLSHPTFLTHMRKFIARVQFNRESERCSGETKSSVHIVTVCWALRNRCAETCNSCFYRHVSTLTVRVENFALADRNLSRPWDINSSFVIISLRCTRRLFFSIVCVATKSTQLAVWAYLLRNQERHVRTSCG